MDKKRQSAVFNQYGNIYKTILSNIYPAKNSTGFAEKNLSVNFSKAYETVASIAGETAFSWFEFQFGSNNNFHVDAVIINETVGDMLIVEAKRFSNPTKKIGEIEEDIERIYKLVWELQNENERRILRIDMSKVNRCYGVILADAWTGPRLKTAIVNSYLVGVQKPESANSFLNKYYRESIRSRKFPALAYDVRSMEEIADVQSYNLVSFLWQIF